MRICRRAVYGQLSVNIAEGLELAGK